MYLSPELQALLSQQAVSSLYHCLPGGSIPEVSENVALGEQICSPYSSLGFQLYKKKASCRKCEQGTVVFMEPAELRSSSILHAREGPGEGSVTQEIKTNGYQAGREVFI